MPLASMYDLLVTGNEVLFREHPETLRTLQPGDFVDLLAESVGGAITVRVQCNDFHNPVEVRGIGSHPDPENPEHWDTTWNCVSATVELFAGESTTPVGTWMTRDGPQGDPVNEFVFDAGPINRQVRTTYRLRVSNSSQTVITASPMLFLIRDQDYVGETRVPLSVLNYAFNVVLDAVAPQVALVNQHAVLSFSPELGETLHLEGDHSLGTFRLELDSPVDLRGEVTSVDVKAGSGTLLRDAVEERWQAVDSALRAGGASSGLTAAINANNEWKADWLAKVPPDCLVVHVRMLASTIDLRKSVVTFDVDLGSIDDVAVHVYMAFLPDLGWARTGHVLILVPAEVTGVAGVAVDLGLTDAPEEVINDKLLPYLEQYLPTVYRYFAEVLVRLSPFLNDFPPIFLEAKGTEDAILVRWTTDPADQRAAVPERTGHPVRAGGRAGGGAHVSVGEVGSIEVPPDAPPFDPGGMGEVPSAFLLGDQEHLARLDEIKTIVVLMMENRSFDHLLGFMRQLRGDKYDGFTGDETNTYSEAGAEKTVRMVRATDAVPDPITQIMVDPYHGTSHVIKQIADGAMSGFASDLLEKGDPQLAFTYYTPRELPNLYAIAMDFMVCDRWFAAHPGGTYPNRWITLGGTAPGLSNIPVDDPRLGFMRELTIFDILDEAGVSWAYFENNVSMLRMYSGYRLDDEHVLPFEVDKSEKDENLRKRTFIEKARNGDLPEIVFIDPRFTGIPPLRAANDDHPAADLLNGQLFLTRVFNALVQSPQWDKMLFLVTYDEHGGFYDHVAPPGTDLGPAEWSAGLPLIHPDGRKYMGPRVPTLIVSPYVNAECCSTVFDFTAIIKTILTRYRTKFQRYQFERFGPRVMMMNHLGAALDRDEPRPDIPQALPLSPHAPVIRSQPATARSARPLSMTPDSDQEDFHLSLARAMLPRL